MKTSIKRDMQTLIALTALLFIAPDPLSAVVPSVMNFQAILLDDQGRIVPDSSYDIVFTIHPDSVSFPPEIVVWTELKTVETSGGLFNTMLGTNSPLTAEVFDGERWLQMRLTSSAEPFLPRTRIGTTPYSYRVESIDKSTGGEVSGILNPDSVQIGRSGVPGVLSVVQDGGTVAISAWQFSSQGYSLDVSDELGNYHTRVMPDGNGEGGYLSIRRNASSGGFSVDGNHDGTGQPWVSIIGEASSVTFDLSTYGDNTVQLPASTVSKAEISDEPGLACETATDAVTVGNLTSLALRSISCPSLGAYVYASATVELTVSHIAGSGDSLRVGLSKSLSALTGSQATDIAIPAALPTGDYVSIVTLNAVFDSDTMGDPVYLIGSDRYGPGTKRARERTLVLMYVPTAYGSVETASSQTLGIEDNSLTAAEERSVALRVNSERIERELADMKARLLELERSMTEQESDNPQR
jgi:hypothetical protein